MEKGGVCGVQMEEDRGDIEERPREEKQKETYT